ncbi:MAG TPA: hypothetical protein VFA32_17340, partial [Dehalococcoidia bacterium]|nr:hypothetical protein [Dehalococcoidia bacterium]
MYITGKVIIFLSAIVGLRPATFQASNFPEIPAMFGFRKPTRHAHPDTDHSDDGGHGHDSHAHSHGAIDPALLDTQRGIWATKWSLVALLATALFQLVIVLL